MESRRNSGWWNRKKIAETVAEQEAGAPRRVEGARKERRLLSCLRTRPSEGKSRFERWRWKSLWKKQIIPPALVSNDSLSASLADDFCDNVAEKKQREERRVGGDAPISNTGHEIQGGKLPVSSPTLQVFYQKHAEGNVCSETNDVKSAEEDVLAQGKQEHQGKDICDQQLRLASPTNVDLPQEWGNTRSEGLSWSQSDVCSWSERKGREKISFFECLPRAKGQSTFSPVTKDPLSGRSAADSRPLASHHKEPSTVATSCPPSPAETDQTSPLLSYPPAAASTLARSLGAAGVALVGDSPGAAAAASLATAAVSRSVAEKAARLTVAACGDADDIEYPAATDLPTNAPVETHITREKHGEGEQRFCAPACETPSSGGGSLRGPDCASSVLHTDSCAFKSLRTSAGAHRPAGGGSRIAAAGRPLASLRCSKIAEKATSVNRSWPPAAAAATDAAPRQGSGPQAAEKAISNGCAPQQDAEVTQEWFHYQQHTQEGGQSHEQKPQQDQAEQQHQWLRQLPRCRLQQRKSSRFHSGAQSPNATSPRQTKTAESTFRHSNILLKEAEQNIFSHHLGSASLPTKSKRAGAMPDSSVAPLAGAAGATGMAAAKSTAAEPTMGVVAPTVAVVLPRGATPLEGAPTTAAHDSPRCRVLKQMHLETGRGAVPSTATLADAGNAAHDSFTGDSRPSQCSQVDEKRRDGAGASTHSPLSIRNASASLPTSAPSASAGASGSSSRQNSLRRSTGGLLSSGGSSGSCLRYNTALSSSSKIGAARPTAPPGPQAATQMVPKSSNVYSSSLFSRPPGTKHIITPPCDTTSSLCTSSSAVASTRRIASASQSALPCPAAPPFSPSLPRRTRSSSDVQAFGEKTPVSHSRQRRHSAPSNRPEASYLFMGQEATSTSTRGNQNRSNCSACDDAAAHASSSFASICRSNAELEKPHSKATTCGSEEKQVRRKQAAGAGVRTCDSTPSSVTAATSGTTDHNSTAHTTAVIDRIMGFPAGTFTGVVADFDAGAGPKQGVVRQIEQQRGKRQQQPPQPVHPGFPRVLEKIGGRNGHQHGCEDDKPPNKCSKSSAEGAAVAYGEDAARQQCGCGDSPQPNASSDSCEDSVAPSTPGVSASSISQSDQIDAQRGAEGAACKVDCSFGCRAPAPVALPCKTSALAAAHDGAIPAGQDVLQIEQHDPCPKYYQQRQVGEKRQQQSEQGRPAGPQQLQQLRNSAEQPAPLADSSRLVLASSLQPFSAKPARNAQVNKDVAARGSGFLLTQALAAGLPEKKLPAVQSDAPALAADASAGSRIAASHKEVPGTRVSLSGVAADADARSFANANSANVVTASEPDPSIKVVCATTVAPGAEDTTCAGLTITAAAPTSAKTTAQTSAAGEDVAAVKEPSHVGPGAGEGSRDKDITRADDTKQMEFLSAKIRTKTALPAQAGGEATACTGGETAAATLSRSSSTTFETTPATEVSPTHTPTAETTMTLAADAGKASEERKESGAEAKPASTLPLLDPAAAMKSTAPVVSECAAGAGVVGKSGEKLTLTEAVLATVGQGVTAALEYGVTTLRDFITESLPAVSSDEDTTPESSPSHHCCQHRNSSSSSSSHSGSATQKFARRGSDRLQRERGKPGTGARRACSAGALRIAESSFQSRCDNAINNVLLPPPLLVRECMQPCVAASTRRKLPPISSTSRSYRRSNSFSEALHRSQLQPGWYTGTLDRTQVRNPSPALLPRATAAAAAGADVEVAGNATSQQGRYERASSPSLSAPPSLYHWQQLPDCLQQVSRHSVAASPARQPAATAGRLVPDLGGAAIPPCLVRSDRGFPHSPTQKLPSPSPALSVAHTTASALRGPGANLLQLPTQCSSGLRAWQPSRGVCSPSAGAAGLSWRRTSATPLSFSAVTTPRALSPARSPHVAIPSNSTLVSIDSVTAAAAAFGAAASELRPTLGAGGNRNAASAIESAEQRTKRSFVAMPPILPRSLRKENCLSLPLLQLGGQQQQQPQCSTYQEPPLRNGRVSPLHAVRGAGFISPTMPGRLPSQPVVRRPPQEPSLVQQMATLQIQDQNRQKQQVRQYLNRSGERSATPAMAERRCAAESNDPSLISPEWQLRSTYCTGNGALRQPSGSEGHISGDFENQSCSRYTRDSSPHVPDCRVAGVGLQQQSGGEVNQAEHLLQPPPYAIPVHQHAMQAADFQAVEQYSAATASAPVAGTNAARDAGLDKSYRHLLTPTAGAETAAGAAACAPTAAALRVPVRVGPQHVLDSSCAAGIEWARRGSATPASLSPALSVPLWARQQHPCECPEPQQEQLPQEAPAMHSFLAPVEVKGNSSDIRVRQSASTTLATPASSLGTHLFFDEQQQQTDGEGRGRSSLRGISNFPEGSNWNSMQQQHQRAQKQYSFDLPPFTTAASGQGLRTLQPPDEAAADTGDVNEVVCMDVAPSTHRGERVTAATAATATPGAVVRTRQGCTWRTSYDCTSPPAAEDPQSKLHTGRLGLETASVGAALVSSRPCVKTVREVPDCSVAYTAAPASVTTAERRRDSVAAAEVGRQAGTPSPATARTCLYPPWGHPAPAAPQVNPPLAKKLQQCQELSEMRQWQHRGPVQTPRPPSPLRARRLRDELLRQRAAGQLRKDNFPLEEVESLLQGFHVHKVNGVLIYDVEGQETSRCPVPQSEAAPAGEVAFSFPNSRAGLTFNSGSGNTAGRQRAVTEARITTMASTGARRNMHNCSSSSDLHVDSACCNESCNCDATQAVERLAKDTANHSTGEGGRHDSQSTERSPCFDVWLRENHRVGEQFLKDVEQIVDVAASIYATEDIGE